MELISRDKVLMNARPEYLNPNQEKLASYNQGWNNAIETYCKQIAELPIIEGQKEGSWIPIFDEDESECSECKTKYYYPVTRGYNFCPHCGAKMKGRTDE